MIHQFKIGDRVIIHKPGENGARRGLWISSFMDKFDGVEGVITTCRDDGLCTITGANYLFHPSWLEEVGIKDKFDSEISLEDFL